MEGVGGLRVVTQSYMAVTHSLWSYWELVGFREVKGVSGVHASFSKLVELSRVRGT